MSVTKIAIHQRDNKLWSISDMLREAADCYERGEYRGKKALLLMLDDDNDVFDVGYFQVKTKQSEVIAMCEVMKTYALQNIGIIPEGEF